MPEKCAATVTLDGEPAGCHAEGFLSFRVGPLSRVVLCDAHWDAFVKAFVGREAAMDGIRRAGIVALPRGV